MSEYRKRILHSILNYLQTKNGGAYVGYADMDKVISSETKLKYPVTLANLIVPPKCGISMVFPKVRIYITGAVNLCGKSKHSS